MFIGIQSYEFEVPVGDICCPAATILKLSLAQWDGVRRVTIIKSQEPRIVIVLQRVNLFTVYAAKKLAAQLAKASTEHAPVSPAQTQAKLILAQTGVT